jgi:hypothetical protein
MPESERQQQAISDHQPCYGNLAAAAMRNRCGFEQHPCRLRSCKRTCSLAGPSPRPLRHSLPASDRVITCKSSSARSTATRWVSSQGRLRPYLCPTLRLATLYSVRVWVLGCRTLLPLFTSHSRAFGSLAILMHLRSRPLHQPIICLK